MCALYHPLHVDQRRSVAVILRYEWRHTVKEVMQPQGTEVGREEEEGDLAVAKSFAL